MLQQCANPTCTARFMYLHDGKVFVVVPRVTTQGLAATAQPSSRQYFWLCNSCMHDFTVRYEPRTACVTVHRKTISNQLKLAA